MRKLLLTCMVFLVAAVMAAPAMASDFKMTVTGEMEVESNYASSAVRDTSATVQDDKNKDWFEQILLVEPIFHINDDVRIHSRVTIMERNWTGAGNEGVGTQTSADNYSFNHNFWWERCYLSFPLGGGHLYAGRMSGGEWAYDFMDDPENRDRIKYVKKVGHNVIVAVYEKLVETDGYTHQASDADIDAYAFGGVVPFSKDIIYKPLVYFVDYGGIAGHPTYSEGADKYLFLNGFMFKSGGFKLDLEVDYIWGEVRRTAPNADLDWKQLLWWFDASMTQGPTELALGAWYVQGEKADNDNEINTIYGIGNAFQPLLIATGDDYNLLADTDALSATGVGAPNGTAEGKSGMLAYYLRGTHRLNDATKLRFILGLITADEMAAGSKTGGGTADDELGMEFDIGVDYDIMSNLSYSATLGYFWTGEYYNDSDGDAANDLTNDVYMFQQSLNISF